MEKTPPRPPVQKEDTGGGGICSILSTFTAFFSPSAAVKDVEPAIDDGPTEEALIESLTKPLEDNEFLSNFQQILDKFGMEAVLFLKIHRASRWFKISGKRCSMRSKMGFTGLEFRIRSTAEMKKLRFDWDALNGAEESELSPHFIVPSKFNVFPGENIAKCFVKVSTKAKGEFLMALRSEAMRDATLRGLRLVLLNRQDAPTEGDSSSNNSSVNNIATTDPVHAPNDYGGEEGSTGAVDADADADESIYDEIADDQEVVNRSPNTPKRRGRGFKAPHHNRREGQTAESSPPQEYLQNTS